MAEYSLRGGEVLKAYDCQKSYYIVSGTVLVFLASYFEDGEIERKYNLTEMTPGEYIPAIYIDDPDLGRWGIVLSALEEAIICESDETTSDIKNLFSKQIGLQIESPEGFPLAVVELINLRIVKDEGYIYATLEEQKKTQSKGLETIYRLFNDKDAIGDIGRSSHLLYDTLALICRKQRINIASFDSIKEVCGRRFTIEDIARVSRFNIREVIFEENWYLQDSGVLLAFTGSDNTPIACIPKGPKKYVAYDLADKSSKVIDRTIASALNHRAFMVYRPFPNEGMSGWDLVRFGVKSVFKYDIINLLLFACIGTFIGLLLPLLNQMIFDDYIPLADMNTLFQICFLILALTIGNFAFSIVKNIAALRSSSAMSYSVQCAVFDRLYNLPSSFFSDYDSADLAKRVLGIKFIFSLLSETILTSMLSAVFSLLYLYRMFAYSRILAIAGTLMVLMNMGITLLFGWVLIKHERKLVELKSKLSSVLYQFISGIAKIRISGVENRVLLNYLEILTESKKTNAKKDNITNLSSNLNVFLGTAFSALFYYLLISGNIAVSFGQFFGFISAFTFFSGAMINLVTTFITVNHAIPTFQRAKPILNTPPEHIDDAIMPPQNLEGSVEVSNLSFKYKDSDKDMVLSNVSFRIEKGEYIGIVGSSGSGKSTLLKILLGFEKPTVGKVYFDDKDLDQLDKRELRKRFGVVLQDGQLIPGSIFENIAITGINVSYAMAKEAIAMVGLEEDIAQMPMGLHTVISEGAGTISGGQKQKIMIARSIVSNPSILFFDEATSALDNASQSLVCESLKRLNSTRLVIAHRLSTIEKCDRIIVLDNGSIVETGTYKELLSKQGHFFELVKNQMV